MRSVWSEGITKIRLSRLQAAGLHLPSAVMSHHEEGWLFGGGAAGAGRSARALEGMDAQAPIANFLGLLARGARDTGGRVPAPPELEGERGDAASHPTARGAVPRARCRPASQPARRVCVGSRHRCLRAFLS